MLDKEFATSRTTKLFYLEFHVMLLGVLCGCMQWPQNSPFLFINSKKNLLNFNPYPLTRTLNVEYEKFLGNQGFWE